MESLLSARARRLDRVVGAAHVVAASPLVKAIAIPDAQRAQLEGAALAYVWQSLVSCRPDRVYALGPGLLTAYDADVLALPNRTPNGVLQPRGETFVAFNLVQRAVVDLLAATGLTEAFDAYQIPCNVRILGGAPDAAAARRPYASSKVHTDVWYGEPLASILFNIPVLGDPDAITLAFFEPERFPDALMRDLADYDLGAEVVACAHRAPIGFGLGAMYVSDSLSLHQTVRNGPGTRLSIDFRCLARERLRGETENKAKSRAVYVDAATWSRAGTALVLANGDPMDAFQRRRDGETVAPTRIEVAKIGAE